VIIRGKVHLLPTRREYDEAVPLYTKKLGFVIVEDVPMGGIGVVPQNLQSAGSIPDGRQTQDGVEDRPYPEDR